MWGEGLAQLLEVLLPGAGGVRGGRGGPCQHPRGGVQLLLPLLGLPQQALQLGELGRHRVLWAGCLLPLLQQPDGPPLTLGVHIVDIQAKKAKQFVFIDMV